METSFTFKNKEISEIVVLDSGLYLKSTEGYLLYILEPMGYIDIEVSTQE